MKTLKEQQLIALNNALDSVKRMGYLHYLVIKEVEDRRSNKFRFEGRDQISRENLTFKEMNSMILGYHKAIRTVKAE
jgi:hypothetical protein